MCNWKEHFTGFFDKIIIFEDWSYRICDETITSEQFANAFNELFEMLGFMAHHW